MDYQSHGAFGLSNILSEVNGSCHVWYYKVTVYIDDLLIHTATHEEHLLVLNSVLEQSWPSDEGCNHSDCERVFKEL